MRKFRFIGISVLLVVFLMGCATLELGTFDYSKMTPKQKSAFFMGVYNKQYEDYKIMVGTPNLTPIQKKALQEKKKVLIEAYPLIQAFDLAVASGQPADPVLESTILSLLNRLQMKFSK